MALAFIPSDAAMLAVQAGCVAAPRRPPEVPWIQRLSGPGWAVIPIASIVGVIFAIRYMSSTATGLTYLALVAIPILAAAALGWAARGSRPWLALVAVPLFVVAWTSRTTLVGEGAAALLVGAQLRHARRPAGSGHAAGLAEARDPRDGGRRHLAGAV